MPRLERAVASLRISGDDLIPDEISRLLGALPTRAHRKDEAVPIGTSGRTRIARFGGWALHATDTAPEDLDAQVAELLGRLNPDLSVWQSLSTRFHIDLFCGWFMSGWNEGVEIAPATLLALGERGILLGIDLYGPDRDTGDSGESDDGVVLTRSLD